MTNVNNGIELKVVLGINDAASKTSLNTQIKNLEDQLNDVKIDIKIDPRAVAALEKLATMDFSKLNKSFDGVEKATKALATVSAKELEDKMEKASKEIGVKLGNAIRGTASDIDYITKQLAGTNAVIDVKFDTVNGVKELKALQTSIEKNGITQKVTFEKVNVTGDGESEALWMPKLYQETNRQLSNAVKNTDELVAKMNKLQTEGKITNQQFEKLSSSIGSISDKTDLARMNQQMDEMVASTKKQNLSLKEQEAEQQRLIKNEQRRKSAILDVEKAMKTQAKTLNMQDADNLIGNLKGMDVASKGFSNSLKDNQLELKRMKTVAAQAGRENIGMVDAFKIAMERFPIWLAASTIIFGASRTAREFSTIIVDIDTKMTNLAKVMSEDTDFGTVFDRATESAEKFGQSISQALDAYTEFARQGFKGEDLGLLADAGLVASNVGEMTAQQASEYMTASLIQWKKDAKDSMGIIDSWNEISNNYATTTEKLAQGQARAGATARAMGLDFDQLNAIIGTVNLLPY